MKSRIFAEDSVCSCSGSIQYESVLGQRGYVEAYRDRKVENDVEVAFGIADSVSMTDQEMLTQMNELVMREFHKDSVVQLTMDQRIRLCLLLKRNFRAGAKQIARLTRLDPEIVAKVI